jgi:hypothetical protein
MILAHDSNRSRSPIQSYFVFACAMVVGTAHAADFYKANAIEDPQGKLRCRKATTQARYEESLAAARFANWEKPEPRIDWQNQAAIIVAPQIYFESMELSFDSASLSADSVEFRWDFVKTPQRQQVVVAQGGMTSMGSTTVGPEILVVVIPKSLIERKEVSCHGPDRISN